MIFCPTDSQSTETMLQSRSNRVQHQKNGLLAMMAIMTPPPNNREVSTTPKDPKLPAVGSPISILDFTAMSEEQQKAWLKESGSLRAVKSTPTSTTPRRTPDDITALPYHKFDSSGPTSSSMTRTQSPCLDDSSVSSSSYASADCEEGDRALCKANKRCIFAPYWHKVTNDGDSSGSSEGDHEDGSALLSTPQHLGVSLSRASLSQEERLKTVIAAAVEIFRGPVVTSLEKATESPSDILADLLRELSFENSLLTPEELQGEISLLSPSRSTDSLRSASSILKHSNLSSDCSSSSSVKGNKSKPPVSFDPRVQVIYFREEGSTPSFGPLRLPSWLNHRSLLTLIQDFGRDDNC